MINLQPTCMYLGGKRMITEQQSRNNYSMRDADTMEDQLILIILKKMNSIHAGGLMKLVEVFSLPLIFFVLAAVTIYVLRNKLSLYILLVPLGLLSMSVPAAAGRIKAYRQNSGINHNIKKCGEHFLIAYATCTGKNERTSFWGRKYYSLAASLRGGKSIENIPVFGPYYNDIKVGKELVLIMSADENAQTLFAIPKNVIQPSSKNKKRESVQMEPILEKLLRPLDEADRKIALDFGSYRNRLRIKYYGKAYLISAVLSVIFFAAAVLFNSYYINLAIVILCCLAAAIVMYFADWRQFKKMVLRKADKLSCLDAKVSTKTADSENRGKYIEIEDLSGKRVYRSTAQEDYKIFERGDPVLLVYQEGRDKPIVCLKSPPSAVMPGIVIRQASSPIEPDQ